ncbi:MAG: hypothetical protein LBB07_02715 [Bifidobacteriaceae bacterium]|jgi:hypothetical protein|nr:hypothetical protein [Bifidobacteriaceae bacterium]
MQNKTPKSFVPVKKTKTTKNADSKKSQALKKKKLIIASSITGGVVILALIACILLVWPGVMRKQLGLSVYPSMPAIEQPDKTPLQKALPLYDNGYALTSLDSSSSTWYNMNIIPQESYTLKYQDSNSDVTVVIGQWTSEDAALTSAKGLQTVYAQAPAQTGDVTVAGQKVGTWNLFAGEGTNPATLIWTNKTLVIQLIGDQSNLHDFYQGYTF